jgi:bla regulator protein blaR1
LHFTPLNMPQRMGPGPGAGPGGSPGADAPPPPDTSGPDIFTAVQEQLGLKLESEKGPVDVIVIDHIDKPSEN